MKRIFLFSFIFLFIDQVIKILIDKFMFLNTSIILIKNFFNITYVHNTGAAWSILNGSRVLLIFIAFITLIFIIRFLIPKYNLKVFDYISYSMLIGGILGNLFDRIFRGYVIDYLDFNLLGYNFPVFNFADILIVMSVVLIVIIEFKRDKLCKNM